MMGLGFVFTTTKFGNIESNNQRTFGIFPGYCKPKTHYSKKNGFIEPEYMGNSADGIANLEAIPRCSGIPRRESSRGLLTVFLLLRCVQRNATQGLSSTMSKHQQARAVEPFLFSSMFESLVASQLTDSEEARTKAIKMVRDQYNVS